MLMIDAADILYLPLPRCRHAMATLYFFMIDIFATPLFVIRDFRPHAPPLRRLSMLMFLLRR